MKTLINGKEIKLYGHKELSAEFTKIVQDYLMRGFVINYSRASSGSQGEEMKLDLSNDDGKTVYRVWMDKGYENFNEWNRVHTMEIRVEKFENADDCSTLWYGKGEIVFLKTFYLVADRNYRKEVYCEEISVIEEIENIRHERWENVRGSDIDRYNKEHQLSEKYNALVLKCVRKIKGYKSTQLKDIEKVYRKRNGYIVQFNNKKYTCHIDTKN